MKRGFKKFGAFLLTAVMALAMNSTVFAAPEALGGTEEGVAGKWTAPDTELVQNTNIDIKKEIIAFNPNGTTVHAPVVTYTYTVTPATVTGLTVTDETGDHTSNTAVIAPVKAGITTGVVVTGTAAGTAGNATQATGTLVFTNTDTFTTAAAGDTNEYNINLDFDNVVFTQPGVYRYQIAETISAASYDVIAMEDGANDTLFLDVYVDGNLDIYGYVCMTSSASVTPTTDNKVNGFVEGSTIDNADKYYTYDLVLSKDVVNDTYGATNNTYPFTLTFSNPEGYTSTFTIDQTVGSGSTGLNSSAATITGLPTDWSGDVQVKDGNATEGTTVGDITLTGIPAGVDVNVYETNNVTGVTYSVETKVNGTTAATDDSVVTGAQSSDVDVDTSKNAATDEQTVEIVNTLLLISPTGFVVRFAPYMLVLMGGIFLIVLGVVLYKRTNREEA